MWRNPFAVWIIWIESRAIRSRLKPGRIMTSRMKTSRMNRGRINRGRMNRGRINKGRINRGTINGSRMNRGTINGSRMNSGRIRKSGMNSFLEPNSFITNIIDVAICPDKSSTKYTRWTKTTGTYLIESQNAATISNF